MNIKPTAINAPTTGDFVKQRFQKFSYSPLDGANETRYNSAVMSYDADTYGNRSQ